MREAIGRHRPLPNVTSIVVAIPARDEACLIARALGALRRDAARAGLAAEAVVLADGCRDATAEVARRAGSDALPVRVVERAGGGRGARRAGRGARRWRPRSRAAGRARRS